MARNSVSSGSGVETATWRASGVARLPAETPRYSRARPAAQSRSDCGYPAVACVSLRAAGRWPRLPGFASSAGRTPGAQASAGTFPAPARPPAWSPPPRAPAAAGQRRGQGRGRSAREGRCRGHSETCPFETRVRILHSTLFISIAVFSV